MLPLLRFDYIFPAMDGVEHRQLTAQRTHRAIVLNIFHCKRPRSTSTAYSASFRKSHYDYATELFFGFVGGGLAISVFERQHKLDASVAHVAYLVINVPVFGHSGAEVHRLSAHRARAS
jgi:hypothetical protein